jgi:hypothetical protein
MITNILPSQDVKHSLPQIIIKDRILRLAQEELSTFQQGS